MKEKDKNEIIAKVAISIIMELLLIYVAMCAYNNWIAAPLGLPILTYFQMLLIGILFSFFSQKLIHISL